MIDMHYSSIPRLLHRLHAGNIFPGAVVSVVRDHGNDWTNFVVGSTRYKRYTNDQPDQTTHSVSSRTLYDVASVTKSVITSSVALQCIQKGWLSFDDVVLSWFGNHNSKHNTQKITIRHLLTHTAQFDMRLSQQKELLADDLLAVIQSAQLSSKPGSAYAYANMCSVLLALELERVLQKACSMSLVTYVYQEVFKSVGMHASQIGCVTQVSVKLKAAELAVDIPQIAEIAPSEIDDWRGGEVLGQVHDESSWKLWQAGIFSGAAGLFTSADDISKYMQAFLQGKVVSRELWPELLQDQRDILGTTHTLPVGLGWELNQPHWMGEHVFSHRVIGKTGFTGSALIMDVDRGFGVALLTNHIYPRRPANRDTINAARRELFNAVVECII